MRINTIDQESTITQFIFLLIRDTNSVKIILTSFKQQRDLTEQHEGRGLVGVSGSEK